MSIPDNYDMWEAHDRGQEMQLERRPKCCCCKNPIQQEAAVYIFGNYVCDTCLEDNRVDIDE